MGVFFEKKKTEFASLTRLQITEELEARNYKSTKVAAFIVAKRSRL